MNHEQYIELKNAKLAKQVGFDWECHKVYKTDVTENLTLFTYTKEEGYKNTSEFICSAPTQSVLQRWLREVKGISVEVCHVIVVEGDTLGIKWWYRICYLNSNKHDILSPDKFNTYEAALEASLQKCLTLIINN